MLGIVGVDPGTLKAGVSAIAWDGKSERVVSCDVISTPGVYKPSDLAECATAVRDAVRDFRATGADVIVGIEKPFSQKNWDSYGKLCRCVGAVTAAALGVAPTEGVTVVEVDNRTAKRTVSGNMNATKEEVARGVVNRLGLKTDPARLKGEGADSLAIAITVLSLWRSGNV